MNNGTYLKKKVNNNNDKRVLKFTICLWHFLVTGNNKVLLIKEVFGWIDYNLLSTTLSAALKRHNFLCLLLYPLLQHHILYKWLYYSLFSKY